MVDYATICRECEHYSPLVFGPRDVGLCAKKRGAPIRVKLDNPQCFHETPGKRISDEDINDKLESAETDLRRYFIKITSCVRNSWFGF